MLKARWGRVLAKLTTWAEIPAGPRSRASSGTRKSRRSRFFVTGKDQLEPLETGFRSPSETKIRFLPEKTTTG